MASKAASLLLTSSLARSQSLRASLLPRSLSRAYRQPPQTAASLAASPSVRPAHAIPRPPPRPPVRLSPEAEAQASVAGEAPKSESTRPAVPSPAYYQLSFTCVPCGHRSHHNVSRQGYHHGSTLITCPGCRNRHVISDHLKIFGDRSMTVEDLMREKGSLVKRGSLGEDGDIEFWPDEPSAAAEQQQADASSGNAAKS